MSSQNIVPINRNTQLEVPEYLKNYKGRMGTENMTADDVAIPRLKIAQSLTPGVKAKTLNDGDLYLSTSGEAVAEAGDPLLIVPIAYAREIILWRPRKDNGGGILARAYPVREGGMTRFAWDKANTVFDVKVEGVTPVQWKTGRYVDEDGLTKWGSEIPGNSDSGIAATEHFNYVLALPDYNNVVVAFSLSRSQAKVAKNWGSTIKMSPYPMFAQRWFVRTVDEKKNNNDYKNVKFDADGLLAEEDFLFYRTLSEGFAAGFSLAETDQEDTVSSGV